MSTSANIGPWRRRFTVEEYNHLAEQGFFDEDDRVELIHGEIVKMTPIGTEHASHVDKVVAKLREITSTRAIVRVQSPIQLGTFSEPEPDVSLLKPRDDFYRHAHPTGEDVLLVVEVADTSLEYDREHKIPLYAEHGVPVVWLVDLRARRVESFERPIDGEYTLHRKPTATDTLVVPDLEELTITAGELLISG
ncbi:Uma2 family endonuclease [Persicimonas caeni]|nr:Uma2 family endonuclease [Persicimonas caeni]